MKTALKIFWRDLRRILRNPVALIVTLGVCIIPSVYAWLNILANWDPYSNTSDIKVAIVNKDTGAEAGSMGYINAGDMVVERLKENTQLGWRFPNEDDGMEGVKSGYYYATIVIPEDFTASLTDVLDGDTKKANLNYYVNEKVNPVSPKVTDTGADTIEQQIDDTFVGTVAKVITEKIAGLGSDGLTDLGNGQSTVEGRLRDAQSDLSDLKGQLDGTVDTLDMVRSTVTSASDTLGSLATTSDGAASDLRELLDTLSGTRIRVRDTQSDLSRTLSDGLGDLGNVTSTASGDLGAVVGTIRKGATDFSSAIDELERELAWTGQVRTQLESIRTLSGQANAGDVSPEFNAQLDNDLSVTIEKLDHLTPELKERLDTLKGYSGDINTGVDSVDGLTDSLKDALDGTSSALGDVQSDLNGTVIPNIDSALDSFSDTGNTLASSLASLGPTLRQTQGIMGELDDTLAQAQTVIRATSDQVGDIEDDLGKLADDVGTIRSSQLWQALEDASQLDAESIGDFMNGPVQLKEEPVYPVENYGSGVTPFYTNLALFVGGFVLVAIYKLEVDKEGVGDYRPWQGYIGRWLLLNLLGIVQAVVCCIGDLVLGIQCLHPAAFVFAGLVAGFCYVALIYALSIAFKHVGKALAVLLVVLDIPGASGTYPVEMMAPVFRGLSAWLPFTYGNNAMREAIAGYYDGQYFYNLGMLMLLLLPISLLIGLGARRHLLNINTLFDKKLAQTGLMISERVPAGEKQFKLSTLIKVIINSSEYSKVLMGRAAKFELMYPVLIKRGFWSLIIVPVILLALVFITNQKVVFFVLWVISLVVICAFLIVVEYLHSRLDEKTELASMSQDELLGMLDDKLKDELFAFAPIEKLSLTHESLVDRLHNLRRPTADGDDEEDHQDGTKPSGGSDRADVEGEATHDNTDSSTMKIGDREGHWTMNGTEILPRPDDQSHREGHDGGDRNE